VTSDEEPVHRPALQGWSELAGFPTRPPDLDEARAAFDRGLAAYARGADLEAQAEFERAAALVPDTAGPYAESLGTLRRIARRNAAAAGSAGGAEQPPG
jgi:hypothetical protein